jgi:hypothetical protein
MVAKAPSMDTLENTSAAVAMSSARETRDKLIRNNKTIRELAAEFGKTERWVYQIIQHKHVPFRKVGPVRYVDPEVFGRAVVNEENV